MGDCSNFECPNQTWGDKIRCPKCRHSKTYTCTSCGVELDYNGRIRCKPCSYVNKRSKQKQTEDLKRSTDPDYYKKLKKKNREYYHKPEVHEKILQKRKEYRKNKLLNKTNTVIS